MQILIFIIVVWAVYTRIKKANNTVKPNVPRTPQNSAPVMQQYNPNQGARSPQRQQVNSNTNGQMNRAEQYLEHTINETKTRLEQKYGAQLKTYQAPASATPSQPRQNQLKKSEDIVQKAKKNNAKLSSDETLKQIEESHQHKEKAVNKAVEHSAVCQSQGHENVELPEESMFGSVEDLIAKGYDGNLSFERDFVSEASDMLTAFTLGSKFI